MRPDDEREMREIEAVLAALDHEAPRVTADDVIRRARRPAPRSRADSSAPVRRSFPWRWAAGILLAVVVAGGAYAAPGSPVPGWFDALTERPGPRLPDPAGVSLEPGAGLVIELRAGLDAHPVRARARLTEGSEVAVRAPAAGARFRSDPGRLRVEVLGPDTLEIRIPRTAPRVEIRSGTSRLLLKEGSEVRAVVEPAGDGSYVLTVDGSGS